MTLEDFARGYLRQLKEINEDEFVKRVLDLGTEWNWLEDVEVLSEMPELNHFDVEVDQFFETLRCL